MICKIRLVYLLTFTVSTDIHQNSSSKKTLRIWAIFLFGRCGVLHISLKKTVA